ncbi:MAG: ABC transporter permease [Bacteroidetes bacterium]|nr:ABC transporter permease [Bacteroidota bacterium]
MLKSYFKIAWRYLLKDRQFTVLNLIGLSTGLACALLIYFWVTDELSIDRFHKHGAWLFQAIENRQRAGGIWTARTTSPPTADALQKAFPEVEDAVATCPSANTTLSLADGKSIRVDGKYAGKDFFNIFSYGLVVGDIGKVLVSPNSIALSDVLAKKLFGTTTNLIGRTVVFQQKQQYAISGIFKEPGARSSDRFDFVLPIERLKDQGENLNTWESTFVSTYVLLKPGTDIGRLNARLRGFVQQMTNNAITHRTLFLTRYSDGYLYGRYDNGVQAGGRIEYVRLFSIIAIFILVIACINFMNLSTAKAAERAKEVGVRKTMGASRTLLLLQYLGESTLLAFTSLVLATLFLALLLPEFNFITGKQLSLGDLHTGAIAGILGITLVTGLLSGSYPALYLSGFAPVDVLKGKLRHSTRELFIRRGLAIFQFALSTALIIGVLVVYRQISYIQTRNLGYDRDNIISFTNEGRLKDTKQRDAFLDEIRRVPGILSASGMSHSLTGHNNGTYGVYWEGKDPKDHTEFEVMNIDYGLMETLGMQMQEGRTFSRDFGADSTRIIFNEAAIRFMGLTDPIGKIVKVWGEDKQIIGVAKDFHFESLHEKIKPLFFELDPRNAYRFVAKLQAGKERQAIRQLQQVYSRFNPGFSFDYTFLDKDYQNIYLAERRVSILSRYFAGLAVLISCLGLFGLAAFTAQRRSKEIGIRKVLGASVNNVVLLLSKDFLQLVLASLLIAFPLAWWVLNQWLNGFAYHITIGIGIFAIAGMLIMVITLCTISWQSVRAALANPVRSLKSE